MRTIERREFVDSSPPTAEFKIVVAGDVMTEWILAQSKVRNRAEHAALFDTANYMEPYVKPAGAISTAEIIVRMLAGLSSVSNGLRPTVLSPTGWEKTHSDIRVDETYWGSYVTCAQFPKRGPADGEVVWRIKQQLGIDRKKPTDRLTNLSPADIDGDASLVIVNQTVGDEAAGHGFMVHPEAWPTSLAAPQNRDAWLIVEWSRPRLDARAKFWDHISSCDRFGGRIIMVVTVDDLRLAGLRISRGLSWERTLTELFEEVEKRWHAGSAEQPGPLDGCAYLVVSFGSSGAVVFTHPSDRLRAKLIYDPEHVEGSWAEQFEGSMSGATRCMVAGVAMDLIRARGDLGSICASGNFAEFSQGLKAGVVAARRLLEIGYIPIGAQELGDTELPKDLRFPSSVIACVLRSAVAEVDVADEVEKVTSPLRTALLAKLDELRDVKAVIRRVNAALEPLHFDPGALAEEIRRIHKDWIRFEAHESAYDELTADDRASIPYDKFESGIAERFVDRIMLFVSPDRTAIAEAADLQEVHIDGGLPNRDWSILDTVYARGMLESDERNEKNAEKTLSLCSSIVEYGDSSPLGGCYKFPTRRIGKLFVTNREELESLTAVRALMINYVNSNISTPLSIAVFGSPGSGKSFSIKQLAESMSKGRFSRIETRVFNLSQFNGPEAIAVALQQVRDDGLSGKLPLVFWDEFDTPHETPLGWLRYFLSPMQDGKYQDGSAIYYIGKAIFVFAGGTHSTMEEFLREAKVDDKEPCPPVSELGRGADAAVVGRWSGTNGTPAENGRSPDDREYSEEAKTDKVPDFVSRLKGFVDVPRLDYECAKDEAGDHTVIDAATALRRAKLLRSFLEDSAGNLEETVTGKRGNALKPKLTKRLNVDKGVVAAFLRVRRYRFGARSMEAIVKMSAIAGRVSYDRSSLPPANQLNLHVDAKEFLDLANRFWP